MPTATGRVGGIDLARALAIFGMVSINFNSAMGGEESGPYWLSVLFGAIEGRAAVLFAILAGVGVSFMAGNEFGFREPEFTARRRIKLSKRALFLFVLGLSYTEIWPPDILHFHGAYLIFALVLVRASGRVLWGCAFVVAGISVLLTYLFDYAASWDFDEMEYLDFWSFEGMVRHMFFNGYFPFFPWSAFVLTGMWLGRQDLGSARFRKRVFLSSLLVFCLSEAASRAALALYALPRIWPVAPNLDYYLQTSPYPPSVFFVASGASTALMAIAASLHIGDRYGDAAWMRPLTATGRTALTIYVGHVFVGMGILDRLGLLVENQPAVFVLFLSVAFNIAAIFFSYYWEKKYGLGPLEWVMRRFSETRVG